jgi:hypothetical protein
MVSEQQGDGDRRVSAPAAKIRDFVSTLHVIAAGDGPEQRLKRAVEQAFARFVKEAQAPLGNPNAVQVSVIRLQDELTAAMIQPHSERFEIVRAWAHELTIEWLRDN